MRKLFVLLFVLFVTSSAWADRHGHHGGWSRSPYPQWEEYRGGLNVASQYPGCNTAFQTEWYGGGRDYCRPHRRPIVFLRVGAVWGEPIWSDPLLSPFLSPPPRVITKVVVVEKEVPVVISDRVPSPPPIVGWKTIPVTHGNEKTVP